MDSPYMLIENRDANEMLVTTDMRTPRTSSMQPYTVADFNRDFPDDKACLDWLLNERYPEGVFCENCGKVTKHHFIESRRSYSCQECGHHVHPTAGTVFHKSSTPLTIWFYTVFRLAETHGEVSAKDIQRETGVTYKTAWRMSKLILNRLYQDTDFSGGEPE